MIRPGKVIIVGDEELAVIGLAAGVDVYVFKNECRELIDWVKSNIPNYDVLIFLDIVVETCPDLGDIVENTRREKLVLILDHPLKKKTIDDLKKHYREIARRILGVEIEL